MGGLTLMPSWNVDVVKLWIFSTSTVRKKDALLQFRENSKPMQEQRDSIAQELLDLIRRGDACVLAQCPGQVLSFAVGHTHAVVTAFRSNDIEPPVCLMKSKCVVSSIGLAMRTIPYRHIFTADNKTVREANAAVRARFTALEVKKHKDLVRVSVDKHKATVRRKKQLNKNRYTNMCAGKKK